jgi:APA family basic amino acid/polyamine antiporter
VLAFWLVGSERTALIKMEQQPITFDAISATAILALWGFLGLETATVPGDKVIDPQKNIPRATFFGTLLVAAIYVLACTTVMLLIPSAELAKSNAPFADVVQIFWGSDMAKLLALFAFISGFGALNGWVLVHAEMPAVMARAGVFPAIFARESKYHTPGASLIITGILASIFVLMNYSKSMVETFSFIVLISTSANLFMYVAVSLSAIKLARKGIIESDWRFYLVVLVATIYSVWALNGAGLEPFLWSVALFAVGMPIYFWRRQHLRAQTNVVAAKSA